MPYLVRRVNIQKASVHIASMDLIKDKTGSSKNIETKEEKMQKKQSQEQSEQGQISSYNKGRPETWKKKNSLERSGFKPKRIG